MSVTNWGILGASKFAKEQMGPALHAAKGARLAGLGTSSEDKAQGFKDFAPDLAMYDSYESLLAAPEIDAVYIPLPHHLHVEWALKALDAGKHVLVEKPVAMAAEHIDPLIAKRDETGLFCAEAYMIVHHPQWQRVKHLLADGAIGRLIHVNGIFTYDNSGDPGNLRNTKGSGGGIPDIGVYTYGATRWATGQEPTEITHAQIDYENGVDVIARVSAQFDGFTATWVNSMRMHLFQEMIFHGAEGVIKLTAPFNANVYDGARIEIHQPGLGLRVERFPAANQYVNQVEAACRSIQAQESYPWSLEDARGTQVMIDQVFATCPS